MYRHHLEKLVRTRLDDILVDEGVLDRTKLQEIQSEQDQSGGLLSDILMDSGGFDEWELAKLQVKSYGLPFVDVKLFNIRREVLDILPLDYCKSRGVLPIEQFGQSVAIACWEIPTPKVLAELIAKTKLSIFLYLAVRRSIVEVIEEQKKKLAKAPPPRQTAAKPVVPPPPTVVAPSTVPKTAMSVDAAARPPAPPSIAATVAGFSAPPTVSLFRGLASASKTGISDPGESQHPPLAIPFISMKLHATPQEATVPRRTSGPRSTSIMSSGSIMGSVLGPAGTQAPEPTLPATPRGIPVPALTASPAPQVPDRASEPIRPRISRAAPIIPVALSAAAPKSSAEWESVFDLGENAVRESSTGEQPLKPKSRT